MIYNHSFIRYEVNIFCHQHNICFKRVQRWVIKARIMIKVKARDDFNIYTVQRDQRSRQQSFVSSISPYNLVEVGV